MKKKRNWKMSMTNGNEKLACVVIFGGECYIFRSIC